MERRNALVAWSALLSLMVGGLAAPAMAAPINLAAESTGSFFNPCAVFKVGTEDSKITRLSYGEIINLDFNYRTDNRNQGNNNTRATFEVTGQGVGESSQLRYELDAQATLDIKAIQDNGGTAEFEVKTKLRSSGRESTGEMLNPDAGLNFKLRVLVVGEADPDNPILSIQASEFKLSCNAENWQNLNSNDTANGSNGKGFGDPWNKYAWSMKDFNQNLYVGTKNAHFDYLKLQSPPTEVAACQTALANSVPQIYLGLACLELYDSNPSNSPGAAAGTAQVWSYNYSSKTWSLNTGTGPSQGFRVMEKHNSKLYAGSDLGSFIMGVDLGSKVTESDVDKWNFPGSRLMVSTGGTSWEAVDCQPTTVGGHDKPCNSSVDPIHSSVEGDINTSFRALASFDGALYLGTFNYAGAELWKYQEGAIGNPWSLIAKFNGTNGLPRSSTVSELKAFNGKLYVGLGFGPNLSLSYLYQLDADDNVSVVPNLPDANGGSSVFKLFVSSSGELYVGLVDFNNGFNLHALKPGRQTPWRTITETGFSSSANVYVWSMAELNGQIYLGTFNTDMLNNDVLPRGSAEIWTSADSGINWQQQATPLGFAPLSYGIRTMEVGDGHLYMGSASNMLAPDVLSNLPNLPNLFNIGAGAEVWRLGDPVVRPIFVGTITPQKPDMAVTEVGLTSARVSWPIVGYADGYELSLNGVKVASLGVSEVGHTFVNLSPNTQYLVSINAFNGNQKGEVSTMAFKTNGTLKISVKFLKNSVKFDSKSLKQLNALKAELGSKKMLQMSVATKKSKTSAVGVSRAVQHRRIAQIVAALAKFGVSENTGTKLSRPLLLNGSYGPTIQLELTYSYN